MKKRLTALACLFAVTAALLSIPTAAAQATPTAVEIEMGERGNQWFFNPNAVTVAAGQVRFSFRNSGTRTHNWVMSLPGGEQRTPDLDNGKSLEATFTITQPGTYEVICDLPLHAQRGMRATLTVTPAPAADVTPAPAGAASTPAAAGATVAAPTRASGAPSATVVAAPGGPGGATAASFGGAPRSIPLFISLAIHIPAAITWLGIVLYHAIVVAVPFLSAPQRGALLARPRWLVLATIPLFLVTGIYQTIYNPFSTVTDYASLTRLRVETAYGFALFLKHGFVMASVALTLAISFWFAPRLATGGDAAQSGGSTLRRLPSLLTWTNVAACAALLVCVAVMVFQLH